MWCDYVTKAEIADDCEEAGITNASGLALVHMLESNRA
jgi:hypothetical protein